MTKEYSLIKCNNVIEYQDCVEGIGFSVSLKKGSANFVYPEEPLPADFESMIANSLSNPIASQPLSALAIGKKNAAIIVSDATRAAATQLVLPYIVNELKLAGLYEKQIKIVVATGVHRPATTEEMKSIAGAFYGMIPIENHDPYSPDKLKTIGTTSFGTSVEVNKSVYESDLRISIGKIEAHEFAGFSGGRKSVLPGISSEKCIQFNHRPENILNRHAISGTLDGNPIHMDMLESAKMLGIDFCVNLVQNAVGQPLGVFAGNLEKSHLAGVSFLRSIYGVELNQGANIYVVTPGTPLNIDLYQSMKALIALIPVVHHGDTIVFYSKCTEGINSEEMMRPFNNNKGSTIDDVLKYVVANYRIQMDHALLLCKLYQKGVNIIACSPNILKAQFEALHMTASKNIREAVEMAIERHAENPVISVIPMPQRLVLN